MIGNHASSAAKRPRTQKKKQPKPHQLQQLPSNLLSYRGESSQKLLDVAKRMTKMIKSTGGGLIVPP